MKTLSPGKISSSGGILQCYIGNCTSFEDCRQDLGLHLLLSYLQLFLVFSPKPAVIQRYYKEVQIYYRKAAKERQMANSDPLTFRNEELIQNCPRDQAYDACLTIIDRKGKKQELYLCLHLYIKYIHFKIVLSHLKIKSLN